jgi:hypothetical protein
LKFIYPYRLPPDELFDDEEDLEEPDDEEPEEPEE